MRKTTWTLALLLACASAEVTAQEISCKQFFMNKSEKRICADPALMQLDNQMADVARLALPHQPGFKKDQKAFRDALKQCKGEDSCLTGTYQARIAQLQGVVSSLPPATDDVAANSEPPADEESLPADGTSAPGSVEAPPEAVAVPPQAEAQPLAVPAATAPAEPANADKSPWTTLAILLALAAWAIWAFIRWLHKVFRRCPNCSKWRAGEILRRSHDSHTEYEMKEFVDEHRDRRGMVTGRTHKKRQVAVNVNTTTHHLRCKRCQHEWTNRYSSRS